MSWHLSNGKISVMTLPSDSPITKAGALALGFAAWLLFHWRTDREQTVRMTNRSHTGLVPSPSLDPE
jgi:hypothetical protein